MKVTMLLADAVQAVDNKLYVLGGGWSITGPEPTPFGIALKIEVPWNEANRRHAWRLELLDPDGHPVQLATATPDGGGTIQIGGDFEVGRPAGLAEGTPIDLALAINSGPLPVPPGGRYVWQLSIDGKTSEDWRVAFSTRPALG